jgi:hypothetical protein
LEGEANPDQAVDHVIDMLDNRIPAIQWQVSNILKRD